MNEAALHLVTANRLRDGAVVWRAADGQWVTVVADAQPLTADAIEAAIAASRQDERQRLIVEPYPVPAVLVDGQPLPIRQRERIRALGPTVRLDLGNQAGKGIQQ